MEKLAKRMMRSMGMQEYNAYIVLELIKNCGPISRAEMARQLSFSKPAISNIINLLETYDLVRPDGIGSPATGRKSQLLSFYPKASYFIGVDLRWKKKVFALVDLSGEIAHKISVTEERTDAPSLIKTILKKIRQLIEQSKVKKKLVEGVGIMLPGIVNAKRGTVPYSMIFGWEKEVKLAGDLQKELGIPVSLENDANSLALGEAWLGKGKDYASLACLSIAEGVGGGFIFRGKILHGGDYTAAQFGKLVIGGSDGPVQFEKRLALPQVIERFKEKLGLEEDTNYYSYFRKVADMVRYQDKEAIRLTEEVIGEISQVTANLISILNPEGLVINSPLLQCRDDFLPLLTQKTASFLPTMPRITVNILPASFAEGGGIVGGAAVAIAKSRFHFIVYKETEKDYEQG